MFEEEEDPSQFDEFDDDEEEEELLNGLPTEYHLSAYPEMVHFKPCYQGNFSHYTLLITNPSSIPQDIDISLDPNSNFSISSNEFTIQAGIVYSLIITFISDEIGLFETDLTIHSSHNTITIPLTAKCIPSPLMFDESDILQFQFSMAKTNLTFDISNRSLLTQLHVIFDFDTAAFTITPPSVDLPPFSSCPVEIIYDPNFTLNVQNNINPISQKPPNFHIQCTESGDSISIPLNIARPNTCGLIDFGCVPIGIRQSKSIRIYNLNEASNANYDLNDNSYYLSMILSSSEYPEISPPFSYQIINDNIDEDDEEEEEEEESGKEKRQNEITFSFFSKEVGDFSESIQFGPLKYSLHAIAVQQPFKVHFSKDSSSLMLLKNITDEKRSFYLSSDDKFDKKRTFKISLQPGESKKIDTMKILTYNGRKFDPNESSVFVKWRENSNHKVIEEIKLPSNEIELNEDSISFELNYGQKKKKTVSVTNKSDKNMEVKFSTDAPEFSLMSDRKMLLKPHSIQKVDIEFNSKTSKKVEGNLHVQTGNTITNVPLKTLTAILSSTNLINFLRIDDNQKSNFIVSFCGPKKLKIKKPSWISCDDSISSNEAVNLTCQRIPNSISCGYLTINGHNAQPLKVPILAYLSSSDISFHVIRPFVLRVENYGLRTAFVTFTKYSRPENNQNWNVSPAGAFIPFNGSVTFTFSEDTKYVLIHSGDEIMRQIMSYLNPDHFYAKRFEGIDILRDEISCIDIIDDIDVHEFSILFDQLLSIQKVDVSKMNHDVFTTSVPKIDFGEVGLFQTKEIRLWIENQKLKPIELHLSSKNQLLRFPPKINLKSEQRFCLRVSLLSSKEQEINDVLTIQYQPNENDKNSIQKSVKNSIKNIEIKGFIVDTSIKFEADVLNFGACEVGRISRGKLRLVNRKKERTKITVSASPPFSCPKKKFIIEPGCFVLLPIHFTPLVESPFQGKILFEPENSHRFYIPVIGFALFNPEQ